MCRGSPPRAHDHPARRPRDSGNVPTVRLHEWTRSGNRGHRPPDRRDRPDEERHHSHRRSRACGPGPGRGQRTDASPSVRYGPCPTSASRSSRGRSPASSAPTEPARRRRCGCCSASSAPTRGRRPSTGAATPSCPHRCAPWARSSRRRSTRPAPGATTCGSTAAPPACPSPGPTRHWPRSAWPTPGADAPAATPSACASAWHWPRHCSATPSVLVLDEPANGLDPEGIHWLRGFIRHLAHDQGRTVLVSSHLLSEMEQTVDRVVIVGAGRLVREGSIAELRSGADGCRHRAGAQPRGGALRRRAAGRGSRGDRRVRRAAHHPLVDSRRHRRARLRRRRRAARAARAVQRARGDLLPAHRRPGAVRRPPRTRLRRRPDDRAGARRMDQAVHHADLDRPGHRGLRPGRRLLGTVHRTGRGRAERSAGAPGRGHTAVRGARLLRRRQRQRPAADPGHHRHDPGVPAPHGHPHVPHHAAAWTRGNRQAAGLRDRCRSLRPRRARGQRRSSCSSTPAPGGTRPRCPARTCSCWARPASCWSSSR